MYVSISLYTMFTVGSQSTKKVFRNWLRYFVFVYQRAGSYEESMHASPQITNTNVGVLSDMIITV